MAYLGSCECGCVAFSVSEIKNSVVACHCTQCRKSSGNFWATVVVQADQIKFESQETLTWFQSTDVADKAFCATCGSTLFWRLAERETWEVSAGAFDDDLPLALSHHFFVAEKASFYELTDDLPKAERFDIEVSK